MTAPVLFLVVALAGTVSGLAWFVLDTTAHRGVRAQTADALAAVADTLGTIEIHLRDITDHTYDTFGVVENVEADVRALRNTVDGMVDR